MIYDMINSRNIFFELFAICTGLARSLPKSLKIKILVITDIIQNNISLIVTYGKSD